MEDRPLDPQKDPEFHSLLAAIVESSDDAIISKNLDGIITSWNRAAERAFGYAAQEAVGKHISLIAIPGREWDMAQILQRITRGERVEHYETIRRHKDGHEVRVSLTVSPVRNIHGEIVGASKIARDITAQKKSEEVLQRSEKLAMLGRLAASIAHEINNPLEAVTNLLYLLKSYEVPPDAQQYLSMAEAELMRVSQIVTQTLGFHKVNSQARETDLAAVLDSAMIFMRSRLHGKRIEVVRRYRSAARVRCLEGELRQVFINLIGNSLDAMDGEGNVMLRHRPATDWKTGCQGVRVTVADSGSGIPPEARKRLFEPFFSTKGQAGNGLGLWITSEIISRHRGRLGIRSRQSGMLHGTVFSIFLPFHSDEAARSLSVA
jgi:PAS domain S-box-containing protein